MTDHEPEHLLTRTLADLHRSLDGAHLVTQARCVDGLLDCYNAASSELVRQLVTDLLSDIRHLSAVRAPAMRARLNEVSAALAVEQAFSQPLSQPCSM